MRLLLIPMASDSGNEIGDRLAKFEQFDHVVSARADVDAVARSAEEMGADLLLLALSRSARAKPSMDLIAEIVRAVPTRPLVVLSPETDEATALEAIKRGAEDCIAVAALERDDAAGALQRIVERHRLMRQRQEGDARKAVNTTATGVLDRLPLGVMILDARGQVLTINARARRIIGAGDGLTVDPRSGNFRAESAEQSKAMIALVKRTILGEIGPDEGCALAISRSSLKQPLRLMVTPLTARGRGEKPRRSGVAIFLSDAEDGVALDQGVLRDLYGLTGVEAGLALGLVRGRQLDEMAEESRVSVEEARAHLQQIFRKTNTDRQAEVVKLLLTGPAALHMKPSA